MLDLVYLPITQYQRDGRILNGVNHGAHSLMNALAVESINISSDVTEQVQTLFESIETGLIKLNIDDTTPKSSAKVYFLLLLQFYLVSCQLLESKSKFCYWQIYECQAFCATSHCKRRV